MDWHRDGIDWPHRSASRFVRAAGIDWHVQVQGRGPGLLLLHGTGSSTHSWRGLAPLLASRFTVVAPDLPGHAFTGALPGRQMSLRGMSDAVGELLRVLEVQPELAIGHSAGAAIGLRMALDGRLPHLGLAVALNGALQPLDGWMRLLSPAAKLLAAAPLVPWLVSTRARDVGAVQRLVATTGSTLDATGAALYARLMREPAHVAGVLSMMANWELETLARDLPSLRVPLLLVVGSADRTVPPVQAARVAAVLSARSVDSRLPSRVVELPGLGHLAHEEDPAAVAALVIDAACGHSIGRKPTVPAAPAASATGGPRATLVGVGA